MTAREEILAAVRAAVDGAPSLAPAPPRPVAPAPDKAVMLDRFAELVEDYRADVIRCTPPELPAQVLFALGDARRVLLPEGLPEAVVEAVRDHLGASETSSGEVPDGDLERYDSVVTTCAAGISATGTVVLDHGTGQGRRALTLLPDRHVCIVRADQVVPDVPEAVDRHDPLRAADVDQRSERHERHRAQQRRRCPRSPNPHRDPRRQLRRRRPVSCRPAPW